MKSPQRILVFRPASLGDTLVSIPAFRLIRQTYPQAHLTVLTAVPQTTKAVPLDLLLGPSGLVDAAIHYQPGGTNPSLWWKMRARLRREKFDLVIHLTQARNFAVSLRDFLFFKSCGIPQVKGVPWGKDLGYHLRPGESIYESEARRLVLRLPGGGKIKVDDPAWHQLQLPAATGAEAENILREGKIISPFMVASLGTKLVLKNWGVERWRQLLREISATYPNLHLIMIGSADEEAVHQEILKEWKPTTLNLSGKTSPWVSAAILQRAQLFLGHDSGPMHLAAAVGTRSVAIFSAHCPPGQWFPLGPGHLPLYPKVPYRASCQHDLIYQQQALATISVADVLAAVRSCLG